jgi:hypothetical protein
MAKTLEEMPKDLRDELTIGSARRYTYEQAEAYRKYKAGTGGLAAAPGTSRHEFGEAFDFWPKTGKSWDKNNWKFRDALTWLYENGPKYGIEGLSTEENGKKVHWKKDLVHFQLVRDDEYVPIVKDPEKHLPPQKKNRPSIHNPPKDDDWKEKIYNG